MIRAGPEEGWPRQWERRETACAEESKGACVEPPPFGGKHLLPALPRALASAPQPGDHRQHRQGEPCRELCRWDATGGHFTPASSCPNAQPWSDCGPDSWQTPAEGCPPVPLTPTRPRSSKLSWPRGAQGDGTASGCGSWDGAQCGAGPAGKDSRTLRTTWALVSNSGALGSGRCDRHPALCSDTGIGMR